MPPVAALDDEIFSVMAVPADAVTPAEAEALALRWGIRGTASLLTGERDRNFRLQASDGRAYVLKFANPAEAPAVTDFQIRALQHIAAADPTFPVPRVVPLPDGEVEVLTSRADGTPRRARLLTWLDGLPIGQAPRSAAQRRSCGGWLARLGLALAGFRHAAAAHPLIWDLAQLPRLREVVAALDDAGARAAVTGVLDAYDREVAPVLPRLRRQVVHNDMNAGNTLVAPEAPDRLTGIIDFGDMVETALVVDVAVGATSQITDRTSVAGEVAAFVAGFHAVRPLLPAEVDVLPVLIAGRLCLSLVLRAWHRRMHPENPHYRDVDAGMIAGSLAAMASALSPETGAALRRACGLA